MNTETAKTAADWAAGGVTVATFLGWMPSIAAALTILWTATRIWESKTVRRILRAVCEGCAAWWDKA